VTHDAEINSIVALTLVDLGTMGFFMHSKFAKECNAIL